MWLKILHAIGLTNLSDERVTRYYALTHNAQVYWFPSVGYKTFVISILVCLAAMSIVLLCPFSYKIIQGERGLAARLTFWVDPVILHLFAALSASVLIWHSIREGQSPTRRLLVFAILLPLIILLAEHLFETVVLKPSFSYPRPQEHMPTPWLSAWLTRTFPRLIPTQNSSCPSGFASRQILLLMTGILYATRLNGKATSRRIGKAEICALLCLLFCLLFVVFSVVYRGMHPMFDIAISIGVACYIFWFFYYAIYMILQLLYYVLKLPLRRIQTNLTGPITAASCIFLPTFVCYSQDAQWWIGIAIAIAWLIGIADITGVHERGEDTGI